MKGPATTTLFLLLAGPLGFAVGRAARPASPEPLPPPSRQDLPLTRDPVRPQRCPEPSVPPDLRAEVEELELQLALLEARRAAEEGHADPWSEEELAGLQALETNLAEDLQRAGLAMEELDCSEAPCLARISGPIQVDEPGTTGRSRIVLDGFVGELCIEAAGPDAWAVAAFHPGVDMPAPDYEALRRVLWRCSALAP